ncbi:MAG: ABC transporter permease [Lachnospiraceae bacterium]|nr:ABC transporter permease [Lachnospiraceae bacterium]
MKLLQNELKKFKNQRMTRVLVLLAAIMPIADTFLCLKQHLVYKNLNGLNILFGNFLVMPCLFIMSLVALLQTEEQNDTLKNILLSGVSKWKILLVKISAAFIIAFVFVILVWGVGIIGGFLTGGTVYPMKGFISMAISGIAVLFASSPILVAVFIFKKNFLLSLIISNCLLIINFLFTWQLTMLNGLNIYMPICIAYRVTYPYQIIEYSQNLQYGIDALYFAELTGWAILIFIMVLSIGMSLFIYEYQEV